LHIKFLVPLPGICLFVEIDFCLNWFYFSTSLGRFFFFLFLFIFICFCFIVYPKKKERKEKVFLSLFCSFGEIIHRIGLEHTNAKGTTCGRLVAETLPKKKKIYFWSILWVFNFWCICLCFCVNFFLIFNFGYFNL
jgi:hypothetical protein